MFNELQGLLERVTGGNGNQQGIQQAANDHISSINHEDLLQALQTAAGNATTKGEGGSAQQIMGMVSQHGSNPESLKQEAITLITNNPQILQHFEPEFAKGLLNRI